MKNMSILKLAEATQPAVPVRLYKPLNFTRMMWMKKKLEETRQAFGWSMEAQALQQQAQSISRGPCSLLPLAARAAVAQSGPKE